MPEILPNLESSVILAVLELCALGSVAVNNLLRVGETLSRIDGVKGLWYAFQSKKL